MYFEAIGAMFCLIFKVSQFTPKPQRVLHEFIKIKKVVNNDKDQWIERPFMSAPIYLQNIKQK